MTAGTNSEDRPDIVGFYFGCLDEEARAAAERALAADGEALREFFALKRHVESDTGEAPDEAVFARLDAAVQGEHRRGRRGARRRAAVVILAAAAVAAAAALVIGRDAPRPRTESAPEGGWIDTARPSPASDEIL